MDIGIPSDAEAKARSALLSDRYDAWLEAHDRTERAAASDKALEDFAVALHNVTVNGDAIPKEAFAREAAAYGIDLRVCASCDMAGGQHARACDVDPQWADRT